MRVLVAMSGGIDSSVAAYLLKSQGHDIQAVTMTLWDRKDAPCQAEAAELKDACFSPNEAEDVEKAKDICSRLGIRHTALDLSKIYKGVVLENFKSEYLRGRTPNPCVICNERIKFGALVEAAWRVGLGFDLFATGHYVRTVFKNGRHAIRAAKDATKDQSYFLYRLSQEQLARACFPLGELTKKEVREMDVSLGFHSKSQGESMDFYSGDYSELLSLAPREGDIVDEDGKVLGKHKGYWNYTIGQRKGLGVGGMANPLYVIRLDPVRNEVVVADSEAVCRYEIGATDLCFMALDSRLAQGAGVQRGFAKVRSTSALSPCEFTIKDGKLIVTFQEPVFAPAPGQSAVVYDEDGVVLVGGVMI